MFSLLISQTASFSGENLVLPRRESSFFLFLLVVAIVIETVKGVLNRRWPIQVQTRSRAANGISIVLGSDL